MKYIYLDNYRGFQKAVVPVKGVNFCVGENSSGKTSFLTAIGLFASNRFWYEQSFDVVENGYRHFSDYVSVSSEDKSYFKMGFAEEWGDDDGEVSSDRVSGYLFKYEERKGAPSISCCTTNIGNHLITIYFGDGEIRYSHSRMKDKLSIGDFGESTFLDWSKIQDSPESANLKVLDNGMAAHNVPPLFIAFAVSQNVLKKKGPSYPLIRPPFGGNSAWVAPIRIKPRRTYDEPNISYSPEGLHSPYLIKRLLDDEAVSEKFSVFLSGLGGDSGLFREIKVHEFGASSDSRFEIEVVLEDKSLNMSNVGYGVSQALPIIAEAFARPEGALFAIQQPEVHLHPRAQAAIGGMIFTLSTQQNKQFVVETHSDFTIDRYRVLQSRSGLKSSGQVLFFERESGFNKVTIMDVGDDGSLPESQPDSYREFFLNESMDVMRV